MSIRTRRRLRRSHKAPSRRFPWVENLESRHLLAGDVLAASTQSVAFQTQQQSMWGPDFVEDSVIDTGALFAGADWEVLPGEINPRLDDPLGTGSYIELDGSTSGRIGVDFRAQLDLGSVDASYGTEAMIEVIEGEGNRFTIESKTVGTPTGSLDTRSPNVDIESNFIFEFAAALSVDAQVQTPDIEIFVPTVTWEERCVFPGTIFEVCSDVPIFGTRPLTIPGVELASFNEEIFNFGIAESVELLKVTNSDIRILEQSVASAEDGENLKFTFDLGFSPTQGLDVSQVEDGNPNKNEKPHETEFKDLVDVGVSFSMGDITLEVPTLNLQQDTFDVEDGASGLRTSGETNLAGIDVDADFLASFLFGLPPLGASSSVEIGPVSLFDFSYDLLDVDVGPQFSILQDFEFVPELMVQMDFGTEVSIGGQLVDTYTMPVGSNVEVEFDGASAGEDLAMTTSYFLRNEFTNLTNLQVAPSVDVLAFGASFGTFLGPLFEGALYDPERVVGPAAPLATIFGESIDMGETFELEGFSPVAGETITIDFNQPPELLSSDLLLPATVAEGGAFVLSGEFRDADVGQSHTVTIEWGDATPNTVIPLGPDVFDFTAPAHSYPDNQDLPFEITVTVTDEDGESAQASTSILVENVPPTLEIEGASDVNEGSSYTLSFAGSDVGQDTISEWSIDWGDGHSTTVDGSFTQATHTYADGDSNPIIQVSATDEDGTFLAAPFPIAVNNVAPELTLVGAAAIDEGTEYSLEFSATDVGEDTISEWLIDWGDGHMSMVDGASTSAVHTYADGDAEYAIEVTATDEDGSYLATPLNVLVNNVAPVLSVSGASSVDEGAPYTLQLSSTDVGDDTISEWLVHWGDGNVSTVNGTATSAVHTYADGDATHSVSVWATDEDGTFAAVPLQVAVNNVAPQLVLNGDALNLDEEGNVVPFSGVRGQLLSFSGAVTDAGFANALQNPPSQETFTYTIDFGDGTTTETMAAGIDQLGEPGATTRASFATAHVYEEAGTYLMEVTVSDDDGGVVVVTQIITIDVAASQVGGDLAVGGSLGDDHLQFHAHSLPGQTSVELGGQSLGVFSTPTNGRLLVFVQAGNDHVTVAGSLDMATLIDGGEGDDRLKGGGGPDVLLGGAGDDLLIGKSGRDLIIGGAGADRMVGGSDDDILIAGTVAFENRSSALSEVMEEWTSENDYLTRLANLNGTAPRPDRLNGDSFLNGVSVQDDVDKDKLTGSSGMDWFFLDSLDKATDLNDEAFADDLDFILS